MPLAVPALPPLLDVAAIAVFALTGAAAGARLKQTFVTMAFFALVTGVGGGTVRDILIGAPVFWTMTRWWRRYASASRCSPGSRPGAGGSTDCWNGRMRWASRPIR